MGSSNSIDRISMPSFYETSDALFERLPSTTHTQLKCPSEMNAVCVPHEINTCGCCTSRFSKAEPKCKFKKQPKKSSAKPSTDNNIFDASKANETNHIAKGETMVLVFVRDFNSLE